MKKGIRRLLFVLFLASFLFSVCQLYTIYKGYAEAKSQYSKLEQYVHTDAPSPPPEASQAADAPDALPWPQVDFAVLSQINPDIVGWLCIEGTQINYPIVQGADNEYYLKHQFDKRYNRSGCLFLDASNASLFTDKNSIVYGHYMKDKSMFYDLSQYKQQTFYDAHHTAWLVTPSGAFEISFFSGYVADVKDSAWATNLTDESYRTWLDQRKQKSCFSSSIVPSLEDRVLTLSTCSYEFQNARFVLHGTMTDQNTK